MKGGMCRNPFGHRMNRNTGEWEGNRRLDKIDVMRDVMTSCAPPEYALLAEQVLKQIHNYWYWGLGKNGCTDTKWQDAYDYLFRIRSDKPETWGPRVLRWTEDLPDGRRERRSITFTDEDMKLLCFDRQYSMLNLERAWPLERFQRKLQEERAEILATNREQVEAYLQSERAKEFMRVEPGTPFMLTLQSHDFVKTLTRPENIHQIQELVFFKVANPVQARHCFRHKACVRKALVQKFRAVKRVEGQESFRIENSTESGVYRHSERAG